MAPKGSSVAWDHFADKGQQMAECNICKIQLSFKSSVSNLTKHLKRKHPFVSLVRRNDVSASVIAAQTNQHPQSSEQAQSLSSVQPAGIVQQSECEQRPSTNLVRVVQPGSRSIASYIYKKNADKCKSDIDKLIMDLFIMDFQPFRIVEDKGFRQLIQSAFPFYVIPSRKYFANNLLPSRYESLRTSKMTEIANDVESISITADIWTSSTNDSYMGITGHYINKDDCTLKSILLDCVLLEGSHTSANLAMELLRITEEWKVSGKILLAVSDNGANIKKAMIDLGWKHFACYAHTLNLAVQEGLSGTQQLVDLINKVKTTVAFFKRSAQAWEKLKKYQEQAGKTPKRPLQCVSTRWNSTFYMLQRLVELKEEVNSALSNLNANTLSLTTVDWELCENICNILKPCEEVTREVSAQKYVTGSIVIPITTGLVKSLENINTSAYLDTAQKLLQDLLAAIKNRFVNLDKSGTFTTCMFLDPRFKLYFQDQNVAVNTKQRVIELIVTIINKEDRHNPQIQNEEHQEVNPQINLVWQHYAEKMKNVQPKGTATSRAILEVQRYLEDKVVLPGEYTSPLEWWKKKKDVYPHLYALAISKLNAMATSVPCERLFSSCGLLLNDRRTRLGTRKVQQLMFLNQNS